MEPLSLVNNTAAPEDQSANRKRGKGGEEGEGEGEEKRRNPQITQISQIQKS
jgi:hypothetical protein